MQTELRPHEIEELLPAYALGALEPEEMLAVDAYLERQRRLLARLAEVEDAVAHLAHSAPTVPLPADGKARLLARARTSVTPQHEPQRPHPMPRPRQQAPRWSWWRGAAVVALAAALVLALLTSQMQARVGALSAEVATLREANEALRQQNVSLTDELRIRQGQVARIARAERVVPLPGTEAAPEARGTLYLSAAEGIIVLDGLDPLPASQTYELWLIPAEGAPLPAGLLAVASSSEPTWVDVTLPPAVTDFAAVGVSVEPAGGSTAPTGPIVLLGSAG